MKKTTSNINVSIIDDMGTIYHVANTRLYNQNRKMSYLEIGFPSGWLLIRKIDRVVPSTTAYVSARENTVMHICTLGKSCITAAYVPARENTAYPIPLSTKLNLGRPNPRHHEGAHPRKSILIKPSVYHHTGE